MPKFIFLLQCLLAANLFGAGLSGAIHTKLTRKVRHLSFIYFGWSLTGQVLALPLLVLTAGSLLFAVFGPNQVLAIAIANIVTIALFTLTLWRSWLGSQALARVVPDGKGASLRRFAVGGLFPFQLRRRDVTCEKDIAYGPKGRRHRLDIYTPKTKPSEPMPVLIHVHGGGWVVGRKHQQAQPLIQFMAAKGWLVADINYRLGPLNRMPVMIQDVLRAVAWVKANCETYGGDPGFVALTGGSAGGHLAALAGLASDARQFKLGFEQADCSIDACIPVYGLYDLLNKNDAMEGGAGELQSFMSKLVMRGSPAEQQESWEQVSPLAHIRPDAPPMLILHGQHDVLADFESAKAFAEDLERVSQNTVIFADLPSGQHGYDCAHAPPTPEHVRAVHRFLKRARRLAIE